MKTLQVQQSKGQWILYLTMAGLFLPQGIVNVTVQDGTSHLILGVFQIMLSLVYILLFFHTKLRWIAPVISPLLLLDDETISTVSWWHTNRSVLVAEIQSVQFKPEEIVFLQEKDSAPLHFRHEGSNRIEIIKEVRAFCEHHGLLTEEIGYR